MKDRFNAAFSEGASFALRQFVYCLFLLPFDLWVMSLERLKKMSEDGLFEANKMQSRYPLVMLKVKLLINFCWEFAIFLSYFVGLLATLVVFAYNFYEAITSSWYTSEQIKESFILLAIGLILTYFSPVGLAFSREIFLFGVRVARFFWHAITGIIGMFRAIIYKITRWCNK